MGAGKPTLFRHLLAYALQSKLRLAVVMNEFGSIAIDSQVIKAANFELVELEGGCVCCSLTGEFEAALQELCNRPNPPEHIVVETTGLAEPDAIVVDLQQSSECVRLESVVTLVDCDALARSPSIGHTGRVQIELADLLLLNKTDLVSAGQLGQVRETVEEINPRATVIECVRGGVDPAVLLDASTGPTETHKRIKVHAHGDGHELAGLSSMVVECRKPLSEERFREFAYGISPQVYRAKGFVRLDDDRTMLFNFVSGRFELEEWEQEKPFTQLVFIGPNGLDEATKRLLEEGVLACGQD